MEGKSGKEFKRSKPKSNIATLGSLNQQQESSSDEDGQAFYVGGSDRSGQQVIGPSRDKKANEDIVENMFKAVREQGAQVVEQSPPLARKKIDFFQGKPLLLLTNTVAFFLLVIRLTNLTQEKVKSWYQTMKKRGHQVLFSQNWILVTLVNLLLCDSRCGEMDLM